MSCINTIYARALIQRIRTTPNKTWTYCKSIVDEYQNRTIMELHGVNEQTNKCLALRVKSMIDSSKCRVAGNQPAAVNHRAVTRKFMGIKLDLDGVPIRLDDDILAGTDDEERPMSFSKGTGTVHHELVDFQDATRGGKCAMQF